jgi:hypothetical protein
MPTALFAQNGKVTTQTKLFANGRFAVSANYKNKSFSQRPVLQISDNYCGIWIKLERKIVSSSLSSKPQSSSCSFHH